MILAYQRQLANDSAGFNLDVALHNSMACVRGLMNNDTLLLSECDEPMVQMALYIKQKSLPFPFPSWYTALIHMYLKARGIEQ